MAYSPGYDFDIGGSAYAPAYDIDISETVTSAGITYVPAYDFDISGSAYAPAYSFDISQAVTATEEVGSYTPSYNFTFSAVEGSAQVASTGPPSYDFAFNDEDYAPSYGFGFESAASTLSYDFDFAATVSEETPAGEPNGNIDVPAFDVDGYIGLQGAIDIPAFSAQGFDEYNQGVIDIPAFSADGTITVLSFGSIGVPLFSSDGFITAQSPNQGTVQVPDFSAQGFAGLAQDQPITVGAFTVDGTITNVLGNVLRGDLNVPAFSADGGINSGNILQGNWDARLAVTVDGFSGAQGEIALPAVTMDGEISAGALLRGEIVWPRIDTGLSVASAETVLTGEIVVPLFESFSVIGDIDVPLFDVSGTISQPITRTGIAYAMNMAHQEVTRYTNYDFDYLVRFHDRYYGVRADGLYRLEGFQDEGAQISAQIQTTPMDFGTFRHKRVPYVYIGSDTPLRVKPFHDDTQTGTFDSRWEAERVRLTRGPRSRYFALQVENINGARLRIERMELLAQVLSRKTGRRKVA